MWRDRYQGSLLKEVIFDQNPEGGEGSSEPWLDLGQEQCWVVGKAHAKALR